MGSSSTFADVLMFCFLFYLVILYFQNCDTTIHINIHRSIAVRAGREDSNKLLKSEENKEKKRKKG